MFHWPVYLPAQLKMISRPAVPGSPEGKNIIKQISRVSLRTLLSFFLLACGKAEHKNKTDYLDIDGNSGSFNELRGKWLVINYWASWCKPCIKEIPEFNLFAEQNDDNAVVFAVNYGGIANEQLRREVDKLGITFTALVHDPKALLGYPRPTVLPTTIIIDPQGQLHSTLVGPQDQHSLEDAISYSSSQCVTLI